MATTFRQRTPGAILGHYLAYDFASAKDFLEAGCEKYEGNLLAFSNSIGVSRNTVKKACEKAGVDYRKANIQHISKRQVLEAVTKARGQRTKAANNLGIGHRRIKRLIRDYDLEDILPPSSSLYWETVS